MCWEWAKAVVKECSCLIPLVQCRDCVNPNHQALTHLTLSEMTAGRGRLWKNLETFVLANLRWVSSNITYDLSRRCMFSWWQLAKFLHSLKAKSTRSAAALRKNATDRNRQIFECAVTEATCIRSGKWDFVIRNRVNTSFRRMRLCSNFQKTLFAIFLISTAQTECWRSVLFKINLMLKLQWNFTVFAPMLHFIIANNALSL